MDQEQTSIQETSSLSQSRKGPKRSYGATRAQESAQDFKIVPHNLTSSDTLQGLAIKYGVTIEQIRRVNKLWINDNIRVFKTLNIPVKRNIGCTGDIMDTKCDEVNSVDITIDIKSTKEKPKGTDVMVTKAGKDRDSAMGTCHGGGNLVDITIDSKGAERNDNVTKHNGTKTPESLSKFLNELDDQMKSFIEQAEQQRTTSGVALINNLEKSIEKETLKRHRSNSTSQRLPKQISQTCRISETTSEMATLDHLFEL